MITIWYYLIFIGRYVSYVRTKASVFLIITKHIIKRRTDHILNMFVVKCLSWFNTCLISQVFKHGWTVYLPVSFQFVVHTHLSFFSVQFIWPVWDQSIKCANLQGLCDNQSVPSLPSGPKRESSDIDYEVDKWYECMHKCGIGSCLMFHNVAPGHHLCLLKLWTKRMSWKQKKNQDRCLGNWNGKCSPLHGCNINPSSLGTVDACFWSFNIVCILRVTYYKNNSSNSCQHII